ncbi:MAG TPA: hypothetical protein PKY82_32230 [Pyrinomonadaceae bacterium]|nr:hypothetical protein [Pyrinomonadaceae bacterium]
MSNRGNAGSVQNVLVSKAYQPKYNDSKSIWNGKINHLESFEDDYFSNQSAMFRRERNVSIVLADGIYMFRPECWRLFHVGKNGVAVDFVYDEVFNANTFMDANLSITLTGMPNVGLRWGGFAEVGKVSPFGVYYTSTPSRGRTTEGQGAVCFLTATAIFAEAIRNLFFDEIKNECSLEVLRRFVNFRKLALETTGLPAEFIESIKKLSDALYVSARFFKTENGFEKRGLETVYSVEPVGGQPIEAMETWSGSDLNIIFEPNKLEDIIRANS